eukprot:COSAG03_NODE_198_length_10790_cov_17.850996_1_plen_698_part_00
MRLCHAKSPRCDICPLADSCEHGIRILGPEAAQAAASAARKPKGDASQPWLQFHKWAEEELPDKSPPGSATARDQPVGLGNTSMVSYRRLFKGLQLTPVAAGDAEHGVCAVFPAVNALCHARGAGDYCQLESWEIRLTAESLESHSILPESEQICLGRQRRVGPATRFRLLAKYFGDRSSECATSSADTGPVETSDPVCVRAGCDTDGRAGKILALSQHDRTSTVEAAHAARIARKRRAVAHQGVGSKRPSVDTASRSIRRTLDFELDQIVATPVSTAATDTADPTSTSLPIRLCQDIVAVMDGILDEIERRWYAPKLYILTDFFEDVSVPAQKASVATADYAGTAVSGSSSVPECHCNQDTTHAASGTVGAAPASGVAHPTIARRWIQALRVYHNTDLWAPAGFDNDSNFERNEVWVSMERVLLPIDQDTVLRRRTIDFSTASPPCNNYVCHSMIKPHSRYTGFDACCCLVCAVRFVADTVVCRGSTLHGLEEWSVATGLFTKSKDWNAVHSKWSDRSVKAFAFTCLDVHDNPSACSNLCCADEAALCSALVLHSHHSHNELRKVTGLGHDVKPQPDRKVWLPAAERRRRKRQEAPQWQPQAQQQTQRDAMLQIDLPDAPAALASRSGIAAAADVGNAMQAQLTWSKQCQLSLDDLLPSHAARCDVCLPLFLSLSPNLAHLAFVCNYTEIVSQPKM